MNLLTFHKIAAARGDGLHPQLVAFLEEYIRGYISANVEDLAAHRGDEHIQAGPNPARQLDGPFPEGVIRFSPAAPIPAGRTTAAV